MELGTVKEVSQMSPPERLAHFKAYLQAKRAEHYEIHKAGVKGRVVCTMMAESMDALLMLLYDLAREECPEMKKCALVANGGFGRGRLYPGSDLDLLFLTHRSSNSVGKCLKPGVDAILYPLWDLNLKVGHAVRSISENIAEAKKEPMSRTTLLDSRLITGNEKLFKDFQSKYRKDAIDSEKAKFFKERCADLEARYEKFSHTIFLQEPNVKDSPGGLRDWHNLLWLLETAVGDRDLRTLRDKGIITHETTEEVLNSVDFLMRLRNEMHFHTGKATDVLSLRLQGELVQTMNYEGDDILIQIENLMKDYYTNARNLNNRVKGILELLDIEMDAFQEKSLTSWIPWVSSKSGEKSHFDGFYSQDGLLYPVEESVFQEDTSRLLRAFLHCQKFGLTPSASMRKLLKAHLSVIDDSYRRTLCNREVMENIFGMRGSVGIALREMHRVGILGAFFPEFGALDCLVQHEFFHRYTADEHTLRCIDMLDRITTGEREEDQLYGELFQRMEDPVILYLALLLHDTGRALNTEDHVDGSNLLATQVCDRMNVTGEREKMMMFLVDHHLTFFRTATKKDIDDPDVIEEFCSHMKTEDHLDALLVFTYCDSLGTNPDGWSGWKELAITTLYKRARKHLRRSSEEVKTYVATLLEEQKESVKGMLSKRYLEALEEHYVEMPIAYFRYRDADSVQRHIRAVWQYKNRRKRRPDTPFEAAVQWVEEEKLGYTEMAIVTEEKSNLLSSICCAFATHKINILSANVHTRSDGLVLDLFKVCDAHQHAVVDDILQMEVVATIYKLNGAEKYNAADHITEKKDFFHEDSGIKRELAVEISNEENEFYTTVEVQGTDRLGLLHDLLRLFSKEHLSIKGARITTERNTAIDTFLLLNEKNEKLTDVEQENLSKRIRTVNNS